MLAILSIIPILLILAWLIAELRAKNFTRLFLGIAALCSVAVAAFLWGTFIEDFNRATFPTPHDSPADTRRMHAAEEATTNSIAK